MTQRVSYFDGNLFELMFLKLLGIFVTVISLGLCLPWAFCMVYKWETKHTIIDGKRLGFDGTAMQLFGNWLKWWIAVLLTVGIYALWVNIKLKQWKIKHTFLVDVSK